MDDYLDEILAENDFCTEILVSLDDSAELGSDLLAELICQHKVSPGNEELILNG